MICVCNCKAGKYRELPYKFVSSGFDWSGTYCIVQDSSSFKGVYSIELDSLIIPFEYEEIEIMGKGYFDATFKNKAIDMHCLLDSLNHRLLEVCDYITFDAPTVVKAMGLEDFGYYINIKTKEKRLHTGVDTNDRLTTICGFNGKMTAKYYAWDSVVNNKVSYKHGIMNTCFEPQIDEVNYDIEVLDDDIIAFQNTRNKRWGIRNIRTKVESPTLFTELEYCSDGLFSARYSTGKWGVVDSKGKSVIMPIYDAPIKFYSGYAIVKKNGKQGIIRSDGTVSVGLASQRFIHLGYGIFKRVEAGNISICNGEGKILINGLKSEDQYPNTLHSCYIPCNIIRNGEEQSWYYTFDGTKVLEGKYKHVCNFDGLGYAMVKSYDGLYGIIDKNMNEIVPCVYEQLCCYSPSSHTIIYIKNNKLCRECIE